MIKRLSVLRLHSVDARMINEGGAVSGRGTARGNQVVGKIISPSATMSTTNPT
jgi:hypothetical protein